MDKRGKRRLAPNPVAATDHGGILVEAQTGPVRRSAPGECAARAVLWRTRRPWYPGAR
jgi:hypothetical protein